MKAIIIAAGQGQRLRPYTSDRPKCMVEIQGKTLLERQVAAYRAAGIEDIVVIRGYLGRFIQVPGVRYITNKHFKHNNILESLFCAREELVGDVVVSYGDITFHPDVVRVLLTKQAPSMVVVDLDWRAVYEGRDDHPVAQAELCAVEEVMLDAVGWASGAPAHRVAELGKHVDGDRGMGEFIGLAKFSAAALGRLCALYDRALLRGRDAPFQHAPSLRKAYLTDLLNEAIEEGEFVHPFWIRGGWREIDTVQDYKRAQAQVNW
jgi:choline kinase